MFRFKFNNKFLIPVIVTAITFILFHYCSIFQAFELQILDILITTKAERLPQTDVILVLYDDKTDLQYDWPLPRKFYAALIDTLMKYDAKVIVFDILFTDTSRANDDYALAKATQNASNVVHAFTSEIWSGEQEFQPESENCEDLIYNKYSLKLTTRNRINYYSASYVIFPDKSFFEHFDNVGNISAIQDNDGHFRKIPLILYYQGCYFSSLALNAICKYFHVPDRNIVIEKSIWGNKLVLQSPEINLKIPIDKKGAAHINFFGALDAFTKYSLADILTGDTPIKSLENKMVLVGGIVTGDMDAIVTPFSAEFPGVGVHGTLISNILNQNFIREIPFGIHIFIIFLLSTLITFYPFKTERNFLFSSFYTLIWLFILIVISISLFKFFTSPIWIKPFQHSFAILLSFIGVSLYEKKESQTIIKKINEKMRENELKMREKDNEIDNLEWRFKTLQIQYRNNLMIEETLKNMEAKVSAEVKNDLNNILKTQNELQVIFQKQLIEMETLKRKLEEERGEIEQENRELLYTKGESSIGIFHTIEIYEQEKKIIIIGTKGRTEKIYFSPVQMAFIYYLAQARLHNQDWITDGKILKIDEAAKVSKRFNHRGIVGCQYFGTKNILFIDEMDLPLKDYLPEPAFVRRFSSVINAKIKNYLGPHDQQKLIRTPDTIQDGKYYLAETISTIVFL